MCKCRNVKMGSFDNQVMLIAPNGKKVGIDKCLQIEITELWQKGITTVSSCCGHNVAEPYIAVIDEHIEKMKDLGYQYAVNEFNAPIFKPLSINNQ